MELKTSDSLTGAAEVFGNSYQVLPDLLVGLVVVPSKPAPVAVSGTVIAGTRLVDHPN